VTAPVDVERLKAVVGSTSIHVSADPDWAIKEIDALAAERDGFRANSDLHKTLYLGAADKVKELETANATLRKEVQHLVGKLLMECLNR